MKRLLEFFSSLSISRKMLLSVLAAVFISNVVSTTVLSVYDFDASRKAFINEISALADITAKRSAAALVFQDKRVAQSNLESLIGHKAIDQVCIYGQDQQLFVQASVNKIASCKNAINADVKLDKTHRAIVLGDDYLHVSSAIMMNSLTVGRLVIRANLEPLLSKSRTLITVAVSAFILAIIAALLTIKRIQRWITTPILALDNTVSRIRHNKDFSVRAAQTYPDEVGELVTSFNSLLATIEDHEALLTDVMHSLADKKRESDENAEAALRRKDLLQNFVASASHDLRQPTQAIVLYLEQLKAQLQTADDEALLQKLEHSVANLDHLFTQILDASKLEAQLSQTVLVDVIDMQTLLVKLHEEFEHKALDKGLSLRLFSESLSIASDVLMLERIIRNLLSNAIRYTESGGVLLAARPCHGGVSIEVWDTGLGIASSSLDSIFAPFTQDAHMHLQAAKSMRQSEGFGLGLSIVKSLTERLGGKLVVRSELDSGTVFKVQLPLSITADSSEIMSTESQSLESSDDVTKFDAAGDAPFRVLLVDDDLTVLKALDDTLQQWGMQCCYAASIEEALAAIHQGFKPDAIVSDYNLAPDGHSENGLELIAAIEDVLGQSVFSVIISAETNAAFMQAMQETQHCYIPKPFKPEQLKQLLLSSQKAS